MKRVMIAGAGKIGTMVAAMLAESGDYEVALCDQKFIGEDLESVLSNQPFVTAFTLNLTQDGAVSDFLKEHPQQAIVSCLPFYMNVEIAKIAKAHDCHYFDLTEDTAVTSQIKQLAEGANIAMVPQCGLAPGFISIVANSLMKEFDTVEQAQLRVGALPQHSSNALQYALTWSTDGLINEYGNPCHAIENGERVLAHPLEGLEATKIDGLSYEAFNTSGGLGSLVDTWDGRISSLNYKTMRYPGHCEKIKVLMNDLKLNYDRATLKRILENAIPKSYQDVVLIYVNVTGRQSDIFIEKNYVKKIYAQTFADCHWSAIQLTTASGICVVLDCVLSQQDRYQGFLLQEDFSLEQFCQNRFGQIYR